MRRIAVCALSISPKSLMKLSALTFSTARICVRPVSRLMAPWMFSRSRHLLRRILFARNVKEFLAFPMSRSRTADFDGAADFDQRG
jgi:hypothetical protein